MKMNATTFDLVSTTEAPENFTLDNTLANLSQSLNTLSLVVYCMAFVLGVLGNGVVIWVTGFKMKRTVYTVWFLNLAVADFLFTAFLPLSITYQSLDFHWPFGRFMCKLNSAVAFLNMFASVYILVVISVDRCVSVVWPIWAQNHRNARKASIVSLCVWALALVLSSPYFIFRDTAPSFHSNDIIICFTNYALSDDLVTPSVTQVRIFRHKAMTIFRFILGFAVPFSIIVACYAIIIHSLRRNRTLASQSNRTFKIIAAIIITFFLCWAPFHIMFLVELVHFSAVQQSLTLTYVIAIGIPLTTSLAFLSSCLNPILYVFVGQDFKDRVRKSILTVLETVFHEDETQFRTDVKSMESQQSKEKSEGNSAV